MDDEANDKVGTVGEEGADNCSGKTSDCGMFSPSVRASFCSFFRRCAGTAAARNRNDGVNGVGIGVVWLVADVLRDLLCADEVLVDGEGSLLNVSVSSIGTAFS